MNLNQQNIKWIIEIIIFILLIILTIILRFKNKSIDKGVKKFLKIWIVFLGFLVFFLWNEKWNDFIWLSIMILFIREIYLIFKQTYLKINNKDINKIKTKFFDTLNEKYKNKYDSKFENQLKSGGIQFFYGNKGTGKTKNVNAMIKELNKYKYTYISLSEVISMLNNKDFKHNLLNKILNDDRVLYDLIYNHFKINFNKSNLNLSGLNGKLIIIEDYELLDSFELKKEFWNIMKMIYDYMQKNKNEKVNIFIVSNYKEDNENNNELKNMFWDSEFSITDQSYYLSDFILFFEKNLKTQIPWILDFNVFINQIIHIDNLRIWNKIEKSKYNNIFYEFKNNFSNDFTHSKFSSKIVSSDFGYNSNKELYLFVDFSYNKLELKLKIDNMEKVNILKLDLELNLESKQKKVLESIHIIAFVYTMLWIDSHNELLTIKELWDSIDKSNLDWLLDVFINFDIQIRQEYMSNKSMKLLNSIERINSDLLMQIILNNWNYICNFLNIMDNNKQKLKNFNLMFTVIFKILTFDYDFNFNEEDIKIMLDLKNIEKNYLNESFNKEVSNPLTTDINNKQETFNVKQMEKLLKDNKIDYDKLILYYESNNEQYYNYAWNLLIYNNLLNKNFKINNTFCNDLNYKYIVKDIYINKNLERQIFPIEDYNPMELNKFEKNIISSEILDNLNYKQKYGNYKINSVLDIWSNSNKTVIFNYLESFVIPRVILNYNWSVINILEFKIEIVITYKNINLVTYESKLFTKEY